MLFCFSFVILFFVVVLTKEKINEKSFVFLLSHKSDRICTKMMNYATDQKKIKFERETATRLGTRSKTRQNKCSLTTVVISNVIHTKNLQKQHPSKCHSLKSIRKYKEILMKVWKTWFESETQDFVLLSLLYSTKHLSFNITLRHSHYNIFE